MTPFEYSWLLLHPLMTPLHRQVRQELKRIAESAPAKPAILDVGGRKSHYTIAVPANVHITDIERRSDVQHQLNLGVTGPIIRQTLARRSNVKWVLIDDMTHSSLRSESFDCVVAVEVLEHVEQDMDFVREVYRVLKPSGVFLMTTPNGDHVLNKSRDHKRHYHRHQLETVLRTCFPDVQVKYAIRGGVFRRWGLRAWTPRKPFRTVRSMAGNLVNWIQSSRPEIAESAVGTHHLIAVARKNR